ncbi:MAG: protease modulator HflC, partial [Myxococcota bacterium]
LNDPEFQMFGLDLNRSILREPGVYVRIPGLHQLYRYDRRALRYDAEARELYTSEKVLISVDYFALWQIEDPRRFFETVRVHSEALRRLDSITYSQLRTTLALHPLRDLLSEERSKITEKVREACDEKLKPLGIRVREFRIRRSDYPEANLSRIFARMSTERERFAKRFRAEGDEAALEIRSRADRDSRVIRAEASRESDVIRGEGDAGAAEIYAKAFGRDREFYSFLKSLETYRKSLDETTTFVLTPESHFLRYLFPSSNATPGSVGSGGPRAPRKAE